MSYSHVRSTSFFIWSPFSAIRVRKPRTATIIHLSSGRVIDVVLVRTS